MKQLVAFVMIAFLVPATATVAFAKNPCKEDKAKFCKDAKAAGKKLRRLPEGAQRGVDPGL